MTETLRNKEQLHLSLLYVENALNDLLDKQDAAAKEQQGGVFSSQLPPPPPPQLPPPRGTAPDDALLGNTPKTASTATSIIVSTPLGKEAMMLDNIVVCVAEGKNTMVTCVGEMRSRLVFHGLTDLETMLATACGGVERFVRSHRSLLVNLSHCRTWAHNGKDATVRLTYGNVIAEHTVSRTYKAAFVRAWTEFVQHRGQQR